MLAQHIRIRLGTLRQPHQRTRMRAQGEKIRPELVMQFARDLLALEVLQRHRALGQLPLVFHRLAERSCKVVQFAADRRQFGRAARRDPRVVGTGFDPRHGLR